MDPELREYAAFIINYKSMGVETLVQDQVVLVQKVVPGKKGNLFVTPFSAM